MSWENEPAGGPDFDFVKLEDDGQHVVVVFVCEPYWKVSEYNNKKRTQAVFIVANQQRLKAFTLAQKHADKIKKRWPELSQSIVTITRRGEKGDSSTQYEFTCVPCRTEDHWAKGRDAALALEDMAIKVDTWCNPGQGQSLDDSQPNF